MKRILEALLFVADTPLGIPRLANLVETNDRTAVRQALVELMGEYQEREGSFEVVEVAGGYSFRTRPKYAQWIQKLGKQQVSRLSPAALETLAAIAYKQPVLRAEVERIRGVDVGGVLRMLMEKSLIQVVGRQDLPGKPLIYGTTKRFLEVFGLSSIKDLPTMEEMEALMGDMAEAEEDEVTQIGDGRLPLMTSRPADSQDGAGTDFEPEAVPEPEAAVGVGDGESGKTDENSAPDHDPQDPEPEPEPEKSSGKHDGGSREIEMVSSFDDEPGDTPKPDEEDEPAMPEPAVSLVVSPGEPRLDDPPTLHEAEKTPQEEMREAASGREPEPAEPPEPMISLDVHMREPETAGIDLEPVEDFRRESHGSEPDRTEADAAVTGNDAADDEDSEVHDSGKARVSVGMVVDGADEAKDESAEVKPGRISVGFSMDGADEADNTDSQEAAERLNGEPPERKD